MTENRRSGGEPDAEIAKRETADAEGSGRAEAEAQKGPHAGKESSRRARERDPLDGAEPGEEPDAEDALQAHVQKKPRAPEAPGPEE